jgi:hypothetical protein
MSKPEMRIVLQQRDLEDETPKWRTVLTSQAFSASTLADYKGLAIDVATEEFNERIHRTLDGSYGT